MSGLKLDFMRGRLTKTGQTTCYHVGDDGDFEKGLSKAFYIYTLGQYSGNSNLDVAHYANNGISFVAPNTVNDAGAGLVTILATDTIVIKGSASNDGVYTVLAGAAAGSFTTVQNTIVNEGAGAYVSLYKRAAHANACVWDRRTGLMWSRTCSILDRVGPTSNGRLNWYDAATCFILHPVAGDLAIVLPNILRIVGGAAEITRYHIGDILVFSGFANAVNLLPGYRVLSVTVNGADLDIALWMGNNTLIAEGAAGLRSISLICRSCFGYAAAANAIALAGYTDWRIPNCLSWMSLMDYEQPTAVPDVAAFPGFSSALFQDSTTSPDNIAQIETAGTAGGTFGGGTKTSVAYIVELVRGGNP